MAVYLFPSVQVRVVFGEKNGVLMLSYENLQPVSMAVACMVASGPSKVRSGGVVTGAACGCGMIYSLYLV